MTERQAGVGSTRIGIAACGFVLVAANACVGKISGSPLADGAVPPVGAGGSNSGGAGSNPTGGGANGSSGAAPVPQTCDDATPDPAVFDMRRLTKVQYTNAIRDIFGGSVAASQDYPAAVGTSVSGYSTEPGLNDASEQSVRGVMTAAEGVAQSVSSGLNALLPCAAAANPGSACAGTFLDTFGRRAFRRTLTADERSLLLATFQSGLDAGAKFNEAIALLTDQLLQMPQFLYDMEDQAGKSRALSSLELASRLSLLFWDSIPDDELLDAAESGQLDTQDGLLTQAQRLLTSSKAETTVARFVREWTGTRQLAAPDKDPATFPTFTASLAASMNSSFDRFVVDALRNGGTVHTLLRSTDVFVDVNLATLLKLTPPPSGQWQKASLDPAIYSGVMTQPGMLASLAHSTDTSYVFRGRFVRKHLLCQPPGSPPANAQAEFGTISMPPDPTAKDTSAAVRARGNCGCHETIDPPGLAFENFDAIGQYRTTYSSGKNIDASGVLTAVDGGTLNFTNQVDMLTQIADQPAVRSCFAREVFRFSMSRMETAADNCAIQALDDRLSSTNNTLRDVLEAVVATDAFRYRMDP